MLRTHTCGELRIDDKGKQVTLTGWLQRSRDLGGMTFIDVRDRYGITQLVFNMEADAELCEMARRMGREFVISIKGSVEELEKVVDVDESFLCEMGISDHLRIEGARKALELVRKRKDYKIRFYPKEILSFFDNYDGLSPLNQIHVINAFNEVIEKLCSEELGQ